MKTRNLLLVVVAAIFFASCTNRMYSFRKTYKVGETEIAQAKNNPVKEEKVQATVETEVLSPIPAAEETVTADASAEAVPAVILPDYRNPVSKDLRNAEQPSKKEIVKAIKAAKRDIMGKKDVNGKQGSLPGFNYTIMMLLLVGLICILLGRIIPLIGFVGGILVLVGLILWLINLL